MTFKVKKTIKGDRMLQKQNIWNKSDHAVFVYKQPDSEPGSVASQVIQSTTRFMDGLKLRPYYFGRLIQTSVLMVRLDRPTWQWLAQWLSAQTLRQNLNNMRCKALRHNDICGQVFYSNSLRCKSCLLWKISVRIVTDINNSKMYFQTYTQLYVHEILHMT